jgi:hypothetical protein
MEEFGFSIGRFSERNGICERTAYNEIASGRLIARKVGRRTLITLEDETAWRRALPVKQPARPGEAA